jgi:hypothetical protein
VEEIEARRLLGHRHAPFGLLIEMLNVSHGPLAEVWRGPDTPRVAPAKRSRG